MKKLVAPGITEGEWRVGERIEPDGFNLHTDARLVVTSNIAFATCWEKSEANARFLAGSKRATDLLAQIVNGLSSGAVEINSGSVGGGPDASPHPWHEEWLHHARTALLASGYQETE